MKHFCLLLPILVLFLSCSPQPIEIPDPILAAAIRDALGLEPSEPILQKDLDALTSLTASNAGITELKGIEQARNLLSLQLDRNQITDITPLTELVQLTELNLRMNQI